MWGGSLLRRLLRFAAHLAKRVTSGLPPIRPEPAIYLQSVWVSASACSQQLNDDTCPESRLFGQVTTARFSLLKPRITFSNLVWLETERPNRQRLSGGFAVFGRAFTRSEVLLRVKAHRQGRTLEDGLHGCIYRDACSGNVSLEVSYRSLI
jgi:hypothetical protein